MTSFQHVITRSNGPDSHMIGLGDTLAYETNGRISVYTTNGAGGGVLVRAPQSGLSAVDSADYVASIALDAPRQLRVSALDTTPVLLSSGQYGTRIDAWEIAADGTLGAARPLTMTGTGPGAVSALVDLQLGGQHIFITASRHDTGLDVWLRQGTALRATELDGTADFLGAGAVQAMALATPGGAPLLLAADTWEDDLLAFPVLAGGRLGAPTRLDLRDGLFVDTPTEIETVTLAGQSYALLGAAGSSSITVVALSATGQMRVVDQVNDTLDTRFAGLAALETLEVNGAVHVLAAGTDNGLSLLTLQPGGRLVHVASLGDDLREMALIDPAGLDMVWRDGGLDIFVSGAVAADTTAGRGVTQLRVDDLGSDLPAVHADTGVRTQTGTAGADLFVLAGQGLGQIVRDFDPDMDRLDLSQMGRFYDMADLDIRSTLTGAVIQLDGARVTLITDDGSSLRREDFDTSNLRDLWHIDIGPLPMAPLTTDGTAGADLLDGRGGSDTLLGQPQAGNFDVCAAQVYRLYQATLDRAPDVRGLINWSETLDSGARSLTQVATGFTNSAEFRQSYGATDSGQFVTLLYDNVLGRAPDSGGLANWSGRIERGEMSRAEVVLGFSESAEFRAATEAEALAFSRAGLQADFADEVYRLYRATLDRDPDLTGFLNWTERLAGGMEFSTAISGFTNSAEFRAAYGATDNRGFVTLLYDNVLDRAPDAGGLANWSGRLARDEMSRAEVVQGFALSREFIAATAPDLKAWVQARGTDDVLDGAGGQNLLMGGILSDTFVFRAAENGRHVVVDAEPWDRLQLNGFGYDSASDLAGHLRTDGTDVTFADQGVTILFFDTTVQDILSMSMEF